MHKAGGIIALIAGIFSIAAYVLTFFTSAWDGIVNQAQNHEATASQTILGFFVIAGVLVLSIIILNTRGRLPGLLLTVLCLLAIIGNWAGGIVGVCLAFALLGGLMSLIWSGPSKALA